VQRAFGLPLTVLAGHVGEKFRNHANSAQCSVDKYGLKLQTVAGAKGDATRTLHGAFLAALANPLSPADTTTAHASTFFAPQAGICGSRRENSEKNLTVSSLFFSWTLLAWQSRPLMARVQPEASLSLCVRCATPVLRFSVEFTTLLCGLLQRSRDVPY
jgi:hypothetical protein